MLMLSQTKLDVIDKKRSNIFSWRGQFTPEFIEYLIDTFAFNTYTTFDPFCGSGTVLLESARRNLCSIGYEINPAAYAMSRFITLSNLSFKKRKGLAAAILSKIDPILVHYYDLPLLEAKFSYRERYENLIHFAEELFSHITVKNEMVVSLNALFHAESTGNGNLAQTIRKSFGRTIQQLYDLPEAAGNLSARLCDARLSHERLSDSIDLIITSPPYINVFNYHQNYRAIMEVLGFDILKVAASEIGSNRKNRGNRFKTVVQYSLDMEETLASLVRCLKNNGILILIVGRESNVRGIPFSNSRILLEIAESNGAFDKVVTHERVFINRFGKSIWEDIIVLKAKNQFAQCRAARDIAREHLKASLSSASGDVADDITETISVLDNISPSPLLSKKGLI